MERYKPTAWIFVLATVFIVIMAIQLSPAATAQAYPDCSGKPGELQAELLDKQTRTYPLVIHGCFVEPESGSMQAISTIITYTDEPSGATTPKTSAYSASVPVDGGVGCGGANAASGTTCDRLRLSLTTHEQSGDETRFELRIKHGKLPSKDDDVIDVRVGMAAVKSRGGGYAGPIDTKLQNFLCIDRPDSQYPRDVVRATPEGDRCIAETPNNPGGCWQKDDERSPDQQMKEGLGLGSAFYDCASTAMGPDGTARSVSFVTASIGRLQGLDGRPWAEACISGATGARFLDFSKWQTYTFRRCVEALANKCVGTARTLSSDSEMSCKTVMPPLCGIYGLEYGRETGSDPARYRCGSADVISPL